MLVVGVALSLVNLTIGIGLSVRIPLTTENLTLAGAIGAKGKVGAAMPAYVSGRLGGNQDFVNHTQTLTLGPAEGATLLVIGSQPGSPAGALSIVAR